MTTHSRVSSAIDMREIIIAAAEHIPLVAALEAETFSEPASESALASLFIGGGSFCAVCLENGELCSYCTVVTVLDEAQIINVATAARHKRRGLAREVLSFVLDECKGLDITTISLEVRESNVPAISLYTSLGFSVAGKRRDFYKKPRENALVMIKNLD